MSDDQPHGSHSRRTEGVRVNGRSARVVDEVLRATLEELGRVGYVALRIDDVAQLSGVNKTTVYRRWPSKLELVGAAIREHKQTLGPPPDTGSVREDLCAAAIEMLGLCDSPSRLAIIRMLNAEAHHPDVVAIRRTLRDESRARRLVLIERGIARGELPPDTDAALVIEAIFAPIVTRLINLPEPIDEAFVTSLVDLVLAGARAGSGRGTPS